MSQNNQDKFSKALSLISAKISQFETTLRNGFTDSQREMQQVINDNTIRMNSLEETMKQEINALRGVIHLQEIESVSLRQELELQRLANTNTNITSSYSTIRRELPRREPCPTYISPKDGKSRNRQFSWKLYAELIQKYRRSIGMPPADKEDIESYITNLKPGICAVIDAAKKRLQNELRTFHLADGNWSKVPKDVRLTMYKHLESFGNEEIPLSICSGYWGARLILAKYWYNAKSIQDVEVDEVDDEEQENISSKFIHPVKI